MNRGIIHIEIDKDIDFIDVMDRENLTAEEGVRAMLTMLCAIYKNSNGTLDGLEDALEACWENARACSREEAEAYAEAAESSTDA